MMPTPEESLKEFINLKMQNLAEQLSRVSSLVESQATALRGIEITTTTRISELQKDINNAFEEIRNIRQEQKSMEDSQKFRWRTLGDERTREKEELTKRWESQTEINQGIKMISRLLWVVLGIVLSIMIGFIWQLIVSGGIQGMRLP